MNSFFYLNNNFLEVIVAILDTFVIIIFIIDLIFLFIKAKGTIFFFKNYWLDIIAVFPFGLFFNAVSKIYQITIATEGIALSQAIFHEGLETQKGVATMLRSGSVARILRIVTRLLRIISKTHLFQKFKNSHKIAKKRTFT